MGRIAFVFFLAGVLVASQGICADSQLPADPRLVEIYNQVKSEESKLDEFVKSEQSLGDGVKRAKSDLSKLQKEEDSLLKALDKIVGEKVAAEKAVKDAENIIIAISATSLKRVRALYINREGGLLEHVLLGRQGAPREVDVARNALFLSKLRTFDDTLTKKIRTEQEVKRNQQRALEKLAADQEGAKRALADKRRSIEVAIAKQKELLDGVRAQKKQREDSLAILRAQALRLETVVKSITGGPQVAGTSVSSEASSPAASLVGMAGSPLSYEGKGLSKGKGEIVPPALGAIVRSFGEKRQNFGFAESVRSRGIEILTDKNSTVVSIADGEVIFVGSIPGLEHVVIVDHGARYYSLYGLLKGVHVGVAELVTPGAPIGEVADPTPEHGNLYLEIRKGGISVNPLQFFKKSAFKK